MRWGRHRAISNEFDFDNSDLKLNCYLIDFSKKKIGLLTEKYDAKKINQSINDAVIPSDIKDDINNLEFKTYEPRTVGKIKEDQSNESKYHYVSDNQNDEIKSLNNKYVQSTFLLSDTKLVALVCDNDKIGNLEKYRFEVIDISKDKIIKEKAIAN